MTRILTATARGRRLREGFRFDGMSKTPKAWLDHLLIAWVEDPDGHLVQVAQEVS